MYRGRGYKKPTSAATLFSSLAVVSYGLCIELLTRTPKLNVVPGASFWPRHRRREARQQPAFVAASSVVSVWCVWGLIVLCGPI